MPANTTAEKTYKHVKRYENDEVIAYVYYNKLPTPDDLQEACRTFLMHAMQDQERARKAREKAAQEAKEKIG